MTSNVKLLTPAGWHTEDHLTDKSATTYSPVVRDRWLAKGWPVWPLYTADQVRANVEHHTAAQAAEIEALRADAERYRWLRNCTAEDEDKIMARFGGIEKDCLYTDEYLDTAIDEAMMMKRYTE